MTQLKVFCRLFQSDILDSCSEVALHGAASSTRSDCSGKFASPAAQPEDRKCLQKELDVVDLSPSSHLSSLSLVSVPEAKPEEGWLSSRRDLAEAWSQFPATAAPCSSNLLVQVPSRFHAETKSVSSRKRACCMFHEESRCLSLLETTPAVDLVAWPGHFRLLGHYLHTNFSLLLSLVGCHFWMCPFQAI